MFHMVVFCCFTSLSTRQSCDELSNVLIINKGTLNSFQYLCQMTHCHTHTHTRILAHACKSHSMSNHTHTNKQNLNVQFFFLYSYTLTIFCYLFTSLIKYTLSLSLSLSSFPLHSPVNCFLSISSSILKPRFICVSLFFPQKYKHTHTFFNIYINVS